MPCLYLEDMFGIFTHTILFPHKNVMKCMYTSLMKQQFVVTHIIRQTEILALLDSCVTNTPSIKKYAHKIAYLYSFVRTTCLRVRLFRACPIFSVSSTIECRWVTKNSSFMSDLQ